MTKRIISLTDELFKAKVHMMLMIIMIILLIIINNSILIYLRANIRAQKPISKLAIVKNKKHIKIQNKAINDI
jgi:hypothetical protein